MIGKTFGRDVDHQLLARASNAFPGGTTTLTTTDSGGMLRVVSRDGAGGVAQRTFYRSHDGKVVVSNDVFENPTRSVRGADLLREQVKALRDLGVSRVETNAARSDDPAHLLVGYKVWPKLGYDGRMSEGAFRRLPPDLQAAMGARGKTLGLFGGSPGSRSVQDLLALPGGREAWDRYGESTPMEFDTDPASPHSKRLEAYLRNRAKT